MESLCSHWTDFHEILCWGFSLKSLTQIQVWLISDKKNGTLYGHVHTKYIGYCFFIIITTIDMTAQVTMVINITINILVTDFHWVLLTRMYQPCCTLSIAPAFIDSQFIIINQNVAFSG